MTTHDNPLVELVRRIEGLPALDGVDAALTPLAQPLVDDPRLRDLLQGTWIGHALHPIMTDLPLGLWTSASVLDLLGGPQDRPAARRLTGLGVLSALPTAVTGLAEWASVTSRADRRTGALHALLNVTALACYAGSWRARRKRPEGGVALALAGATAAAAAGYLGGHLTAARKVSSRHPAFEE